MNADRTVVCFNHRSTDRQTDACRPAVARTGEGFENRSSFVRRHARTFVVDHTLTFSLPLAEFLTVVQATEVRLEVGGVAVRLRGDRLEALRDFSLQVRERGRGGA